MSRRLPALRSIRARFALVFIGITAAIILLTTVILIAETHYHFQMFEHQSGHDRDELNLHFEQALVQSIIFTSIGAFALAALVGSYVSKRITDRLIEMRHVAEEMRSGDLSARARVPGQDELADLGHSLNHLARQLQTQEELRKNMTADIAHELRTPLTTLKSHMEAFEDGVWEPTPERIHACYEEIERLIGLVHDLEQLTRLEAPDFTLERKVCDLAAVARQSAQQAQAAFLRQGVTLHWHDPGPVPLSIDPERVTQVLVNLLANALKFTPPGGDVHLSVEVGPDHALLSIRDTGIGIAPAQLPHLFERFYRADKSRSRQMGGIGIGLTIVKRLVEAHGGTVTIVSKEGEGTLATASFPKN